jgi:tRNA-dihydrouridine synthase B
MNLLEKLNIPKYAALAPMASVADKAYRQTAREFGAVLTVSEMVSAMGLIYGDKKTAEMCQVDDSDTPYSLQLFAGEPEVIAEAIAMLPEVCGDNLPDIIDINMGCPVPKVVGNGCGSALMKKVYLAELVTEAAVKAAGKLGLPASVKIRSGFERVNAVQIARALEDAGAAMLTVHPRLRAAYYTGVADRKVIAAVKEAVNIPVIGSGDVRTPEDALAMYNETGCDLVMVGRGSYGRPWLFTQIRQYLETGEYFDDPPLIVRANVMLHQLSLALDYKGEAALKEARAKCAHYVVGLKYAARLRRECSHIETFKDALKIARKMKEY